MSFMQGDRLTLDLEQYFKIYLFFIYMCNNITILAFKYKNQCVIYLEISTLLALELRQTTCTVRNKRNLVLVKISTRRAVPNL